MRTLTLSLLSLLLTGLHAADLYTASDLYAKPDPKDPGSLTLTLAGDTPAISHAIAVGRRTRQPYRGQQQQQTITFAHLPPDLYDLLLVSATTVYEGLQLTRAAGTPPSAENAAAITAELEAIEGFFNRKLIHRIRVLDVDAVVLLQQWRTDQALTQGGAAVTGCIHSLDLVYLTRPVSGWQIVTRRQLYRLELPQREPLAQRHLPALAGFRVIRTAKTAGPLSLAAGAEGD